MKKIYLTLLLIIGLTTLGMPIDQVRMRDHQKFDKAELKQIQPTQESPLYAPARIYVNADDINKIITEAPDGIKKDYFLNANGWDVNFYGIPYECNEVRFGEIIFTDDNEVYFYHPITYYPTSTYMKGRKENDKIIVDLPQPIGSYYLWSEDGFQIAPLYLTVMQHTTRTVVEEEQDWYVNTDINQITYSIDGDCIVSDLEDGYILGLAYSYELDADDPQYWTGYGDIKQSYSPFTETINTFPEECEASQWTFQYNDVNIVLANIVIDGEDIYIDNVDSNFPESVIKGHIDNNKVNIPTHQFLGISGNVIYYMYAAELIPTYYEEWDAYVYSYEPKDFLSLEYDTEANHIWSEEWFTNAYVVCSTNDFYSTAFNGAYGIEYKKYDPSLIGNPSDPIFTEWDIMEFDQEYGYGVIQFYITPLDESGNYLNPDNMYYNIYLNDEIYTFYSDEYPGVEDELTDVPYNFSCDGIYAYDTYHFVYLYAMGIEKYGIQSIYITNDGERLASNIVTVNLGTDSLSDSMVSDSEVVTTRYYDLMGKELANPTPGLVIKVETLKDGTSRSSKLFNSVCGR